MSVTGVVRAALIALATSSTIVTAQSPLAPRLHAEPDPPALAPRRPVPEAWRLPAMALGTVAPSGFTVLGIPVPAVIADAPMVRYELEPAPGIATLSARRGTVPAGDRRTLLVTIGLQQKMAAGRLPLGQVRFEAFGRPDVLVPIEAEVLVVRRLMFLPTRDLVAARPGETVRLSWRVANMGNAAETLTPQLLADAGWTHDAKDLPATLSLAPGATADLTIRVSVPPVAFPGAHRVLLALNEQGEVRVRGDAFVEVSDPGRMRRGPEAGEVAIDIATAPSGATITSLRVNTPVAPGTRLELAAALRPASMDAIDANALARVRSLLLPPTAALIGESWMLRGGAAGLHWSALTGQNAFGAGAEFVWRSPTWLLNATAGQPAEFGRATLSGLRLGHKFATLGWLTATATQARDTIGAGRSLSAVSFGLGRRMGWFDSTSVEIGTRSSGANVESGIGASLELLRTRDNERLSLHVAHAPGGSRAFAAATDELLASVYRSVIPGLYVTGAVWSTVDQTRDFSSYRNGGALLTPTFALRDWLSLSLEGRYSTSSARSVIGELGSSEFGVGAAINFSLGDVSGTTGVRSGSLTHTLSLGGIDTPEQVAPRTSWDSFLRWDSRLLSLDANTRLEVNGAESGLDPRRAEAGIRAQSGAIPVGAHADARLSASVQYVGWFSDRPSLTSYRVGAELTVLQRLLVVVDAEYNPMLAVVASGRTTWVPALRVAYTMGMPGLSLLRLDGSTGGTVFQDLNGNGTQDAGEPGFGGVVVRRGMETAVSDRDGRYRFERAVQREPVQLDPRSLPFGWIASGLAERSSVPTQRDFAVVPTGSVDVVLEAGADEYGIKPSVRLEEAQVTAKDSAGRLFVARGSDRGVMVFDALPPGLYMVEIDVSTVGEQVRARGPLPTFRVGRTRASQRFVIPLYARKVRMWSGGQQQDFATGNASPLPRVVTPAPHDPPPPPRDAPEERKP